MNFMDTCNKLPWGPWTTCINATCTRPGMIYRWRRFPDQASKVTCARHPLANQVDTCWPPSNFQCSLTELQTACLEEPPTPQRLCVRPMNTTKRLVCYNTKYFYIFPFTSSQLNLVKFHFYN